MKRDRIGLMLIGGSILGGLALMLVGRNKGDSKQDTDKQSDTPKRNDGKDGKDPLQVVQDIKDGNIEKVILDNIAVGPFSFLFDGSNNEPSDVFYLYKVNQPSLRAGGIQPYQGPVLTPKAAAVKWQELGNKNAMVPDFIFIYTWWPSIRQLLFTGKSVNPATGKEYSAKGPPMEPAESVLLKNWNDVRVSIATKSWPVEWKSWYVNDMKLIEKAGN